MTDTPQRPSVWQFQYRVIKALVLRDMAGQFGHMRLGYLWAFVESGVVMVGLLLAFSVRGRMAPTNIPMGVFLATGFPVWFAFQALWSGMSRAESSGKGLLMFPQITLFDLMIAKLVLEAATQTVIFILIALGVIIVFRIDFPADPGMVLFQVWSAIILGTGMGIFTHSVKRIFPIFETLISPVRRLGMFVSGVLHSAASMPSFLLPYFAWNPVFRMIEISRQAWHPTYQSPIYDPGFVVLCCLGVLAAGLIMERLTRRFVSL